MSRYGTAFLLDLFERIAAKEADGHFAILRFTTGYKCALGTPDLDSGAGRREVWCIPMSATLEEALTRAIVSRHRVGEGVGGAA